MKTLEERLNAELNEKEKEIKRLNRKIKEIEKNVNLERNSWMLIEEFKETDLQKTLPVPRFEMRFTKRKNSRDWTKAQWKYGLVYKHYENNLLKNSELLFIPFSVTENNCSTAPELKQHIYNGKISQPHRDQFHILAESILFNVPAYIICEEANLAHKIQLNIDLKDRVEKMKR